MTKAASWRTTYPASVDTFDDGYGVKIVLPICPPSANALKKQTGRWVARDIRKAVALWIAAIPDDWTVGQGRRRVQIVCYRGRELDADNTSAGCKPIVDELVAAGLLRDDGSKWCDLRPVVQVVVKAKDQWRTELYVEAI